MFFKFCSFGSKLNEMETITIKIDTANNKGKYLLGLITEMAKDGSYIEIEKSETYNEVRTSLREMKQGKRKPISELF
jgi:hypothetical protein